MRTCESCTWWAFDPDHPHMGECRLNAPSVAQVEPRTNGEEPLRGFWPNTRARDFCREHMPRSFVDPWVTEPFPTQKEG